MTSKPNGYWSFDRCRSEALKYASIREFRLKSESAYQTIHRKGWANTLMCHMVKLGSKKQRFVYSISLNEKIYIGLSYDPKRRLFQHKANGPAKEILSQGAIFKVVSSLLDADDAASLEGLLISHYEMLGFNILNTVKAGGLGCGSRLWEFETCKAIASLFDRQSEFKKQFNGAYQAALKNKWIDEICSHMKYRRTHNGFWDFERISGIAMTCTTRKEFRLTSAYKAAKRRKILDKFTFPDDGKKWTYERVLEVAKKYKSRGDLYKNNQAVYSAAYRNSWLDCLIFEGKQSS